MTDTADHLVEEGRAAWTAGDLDALEAILDPQVNLRAVQAGPWDCTGRDQVMRMLRQRQAQRGGQPPEPVRIARLDDNTYLVSTLNLNEDTEPEPCRHPGHHHRQQSHQDAAIPPNPRSSPNG